MTAKITLLRTDLCPIQTDVLVRTASSRGGQNASLDVSDEVHCEVYAIEELDRQSDALNMPAITATWQIDVALPRGGLHNKTGRSQAYQIFATLFALASELEARNLALMPDFDLWLSDSTKVDYSSLLEAITQAASQSPMIRKVILCADKPTTHQRWLDAFEQSQLH